MGNKERLVDKILNEINDDPCWKGYTMVGKKKKNGKEVPNCVPSKGVKKAEGFEKVVKEAVRIPAKTGNIVFVNLSWRGKYYGIKVFFPHTKVPNKKEVQTEIEKVYPGSRVYSFQVSDYEPGQPLIQVSEGAAWTRKEGQSEKGGLNEKGRKSYERENPGSDLKAPSKEVGNPRRASFCARMKGMRKRQKPSNNTGNDRLSKSLRAWNC